MSGTRSLIARGFRRRKWRWRTGARRWSGRSENGATSSWGNAWPPQGSSVAKLPPSEGRRWVERPLEAWSTSGRRARLVAPAGTGRCDGARRFGEIKATLAAAQRASHDIARSVSLGMARCAESGGSCSLVILGRTRRRRAHIARGLGEGAFDKQSPAGCYVLQTIGMAAARHG